MTDNLTKGAEALLREIIDHRNENEIVDADYFDKKLKAMNPAEDNLYRSCFKELSDCNLAKTLWADNGPCMISLTSVGLEYFEQKDATKKEEQKERRSSRWHDVWVAALGAIFGGIVTFLLFKLFGIG